MTHTTYLLCNGTSGTIPTDSYVFVGSGTCCTFCVELYTTTECPPNFYYEEFPPIGARVSVENRAQAFNFMGIPYINSCDSWAGVSEYIICGENQCPCDDGGGRDDPVPPPICPNSPLVFDLGKSGFRFTSYEDGVSFDIDADGAEEHTSWTAPGGEDGFLVLDRNGDGLINDGAELFGNNTDQPPSVSPNGFEALAVFDSPPYGGNADGVIDSLDRIFGELRIWRDVNMDGKSSVDEIFTLIDLGVTAVNLAYREASRTDRYGNELRYISRYSRVGRGNPRPFITDVWFWTGELE